MLLVADIGNTNITLGIFKDKKFKFDFRLPSDKELSQEEYEVILKSMLKDYNIDGCVIASVVNELNVKFKAAIDNILGLNSIFVTDKIHLGITIIADNTAEVGADRIANVVAAVNKYHDKSVIVIDFGTATTFDIVNSKKEFCGGIIIPGLKTQLKSLFLGTSKLPQIELGDSPKALGTTTEEAILAGVVRGSACAIDGLIEHCERELGEKAIIILTGGYSRLVSKYMKHPFDESNPILTLEGLRDIYCMNK